MDVSPGSVRKSGCQKNRDRIHFRRGESNDFNVNNGWRGQRYHNRNNWDMRNNSTNRFRQTRYNWTNYNRDYNSKRQNQLYYRSNNNHRNNYSNQFGNTPFEQIQVNFVRAILELIINSNNQFGNSSSAASTPASNDNTSENANDQNNIPSLEINRDSSETAEGSESACQGNSGERAQSSKTVSEEDSTQTKECGTPNVNLDSSIPNENTVSLVPADNSSSVEQLFQIVKIEAGVDWRTNENELFLTGDPSSNRLYSSFHQDLVTEAISSTSDATHLLEDNENQPESENIVDSNNYEASAIEKNPPKNTPSISLVPLSLLIDPNFQSSEEDKDSGESNVEETSDVSKEDNSTPDPYPRTVTGNGNFKKPELISRKLINKVATMDKAHIRNVINNPIMKFDVALKMHAKKRLREEIRKQLRNMNFETRKQATGEAVLQPDGYIDPENIPPEMLKQFESVLDMQLENLNGKTNPQKSKEIQVVQSDPINSGDESFSENCIECINTKLQEEEIRNQQQFNLRTKLLNLEFIKQQAILRKCRQPMSDSDEDVCIVDPPSHLNQITIDDSSNDSSTTNTTVTSVGTSPQQSIEEKFLQSFKEDVLPQLPEPIRREYELSSGKEGEITKIYSMCLDKLRNTKWHGDVPKPNFDWSNTDDALNYLVRNIRNLLNTDTNDQQISTNTQNNDTRTGTSPVNTSVRKHNRRYFNRRYYQTNHDRNTFRQDIHSTPTAGKNRTVGENSPHNLAEETNRTQIEDKTHKGQSEKLNGDSHRNPTENLTNKKPELNALKQSKDQTPQNSHKALKEPNHRKEDDSSTKKSSDSPRSKKSADDHSSKTNGEHVTKSQHKDNLSGSQNDKDNRQATNSDQKKNSPRSRSRDKHSASNGDNKASSSPTSTSNSSRKRKHEETIDTSTTSSKVSADEASRNKKPTKCTEATASTKSPARGTNDSEAGNNERSWRSPGERKCVESKQRQSPPKSQKHAPIAPEPIIASPAEKHSTEANASPSLPKSTKTATAAPATSAECPTNKKCTENSTSQSHIRVIETITIPSEPLIAPDSTDKTADPKVSETNVIQVSNEGREEMSSQITSSVETEDQTNNATLTALKDLDGRLIELNEKKMGIEKRIIELQKEKMEIDLIVMQLQNDRFALISSVVSDSNGFLATNPNLQSVFSNGFQFQFNTKRPTNIEKRQTTQRKQTPEKSKNIPCNPANASKNQRQITDRDNSSSPAEEAGKINRKLSTPTRRTSKHVRVASPEITKHQNLKTNQPKRASPPRGSTRNKPHSTSSSLPNSNENLLPVSCAGQSINIAESSDSGDEDNDTSHLNSSLSSRTVTNGHLKGFRLPIVKIIGTEGYIICASEDGNIYKFDSNTKQLISTFSKHTESITEMCIDGEGCIYSTSLDGFMKKTSIDNFGLELQSVNVHEPLQAVNLCWNIAFIGSRWGNIFTYDMKKNKLNESLLCSVGSSIIALKATKEGPRRVIIIASKGEKMHFRDATSGLLLRTIHVADNHNIYNIVLNGGLLYCGSASNKVFIYDFTTGNEINTFTSGNGAVSIKFYKNKLLFVGCYDGYIYVFKQSGEQVGRFAGAGKMILALEIIGEKVLTSSKDNAVQIVDIPKYILTFTK